MSTKTEKLGLFKYDMAIDGREKFSINKALNENWDVLDEKVATKEFVTDKIAEIPTPDVSGQINEHNTNNESHNDIRNLISDVSARLNALANSDDETLDQMAEVVKYIQDNRELIDAINVPTRISQLINDSGFITDYTEADPTVPEWAKQPNKPTYDASEVGADVLGSAAAVQSDLNIHTNNDDIHVTKQDKFNWDTKATTEYVNQKIGEIPTPDVNGIATGIVNDHNNNNIAHADIRELINELTTRLNTLANSDDKTLDQMAEIVAYIKSNKSLIDNITTGKVSVSDIVNNLTSSDTNKPLSAAQGKVLKELIDSINVTIGNVSSLLDSINGEEV